MYLLHVYVVKKYRHVCLPSRHDIYLNMKFVISGYRKSNIYLNLLSFTKFLSFFHFPFLLNTINVLRYILEATSDFTLN